MRIILQEKVTNLGNVGDEVNVRSGYGRNYLIPQGIAVRATPETIKEFELRRAEFEKKEAEKLQNAEQRAEQLKETVITVVAKASDEGKLFGSISPREIADAAQKMGVTLEKREVKLPEGPIRLVGEYEVTVVLHGELSTPLKVVVIAEK